MGIQGDRVRRGAGWLLLVSLLGLVACGGGGSKKVDRKTEANQHYRLGLLSYQRGDLNKAIEEIKRSIELNPDSEQSHNLLGLVYLDSRQYSESVQEFREALARNPYFTDAYNNLGIAYRKMGEYEDALAAYRKALDDPTYRTPEKVHFNVGQTYLEMNRPEQAVGSLKAALNITPKYGKARLELARTFKELGRHSEAKEQLELVVELVPDTEEARRAQDLLDAQEY
jgi:type IV pilus biogenesis/stability protein PilW